MPSILSTILTTLQFLVIAATLCSVLWRRIPTPVFSTYLAFDLALGAISIWTRGQSQLSIQVWIWGQLLTAVFWVLMFMEVRRRVLQNYPGIGSFATAMIVISLTIGTAAVWLTASDDRSRLIRLAVFVPRVVAGVLFVGMAILGALIRHYHARQHPNTITHARLLWLYLGGQALSLWAVNVGASPHLASAVSMVLSFLCFASWILLLRRHHEIPYAPSITHADLLAAQQRSERAMGILDEVSR